MIIVIIVIGTNEMLQSIATVFGKISVLDSVK